jgi:tRNA 2-thiouridine synthesizing protein A
MWEMQSNVNTDSDQKPVDEWDAGQTGCGELLMRLNPRLRALEPGSVLRVIARDAGAPEDLPAWCRLTGHQLVYAKHPEYWIRKKES